MPTPEASAGSPFLAPSPQLAPLTVAESTGFFNPIGMMQVNGTKVDRADPFIVYANGEYHMTYTIGTGVSIWSAPNLADIASAPENSIFVDSGYINDPSYNPQIWAPELHYLDAPSGGKRWYLYYSKRNGNYVREGSATTPKGPYGSEKRIQNCCTFIDATILEKSTANGTQLYLLWSDGNIKIQPMSNPWTLVADADPLTQDYTTLPAGNAGTGCSIEEAPSILQRNGKIFVVYSVCDAHTRDYKLGMMSANDTADVMSPLSWTSSSTPVFQGDVYNSTNPDVNGVYGVGHNGFFRSPDGVEDWIVYHGQYSSSTNRNIRAQKFTWNADGTPNFGSPIRLNIKIASPSGDLGYTEQFESTPVVGSSGKTHNTYNEDYMIGRRGSSYRATTVGDYVSYAVNVPVAGTYKIRIRAKTNNDRSTVQLNIAFNGAGVDQGTPMDWYTSNTTYRDYDLGTRTFTSPGQHTFKFTVTGKNSSSIDYWMALDQITLVPAASSTLGTVLFGDDFEDNNDVGWGDGDGTWAVTQPAGVSFEYRKGGTTDNRVFGGSIDWTNYAVEAAAYGEWVGSYFSLIGRAQSFNNFYQLELKPDPITSQKKWWLYKNVAGVYTLLNSGAYSYFDNKYYVLKLSMSGSTLTASVTANNVYQLLEIIRKFGAAG